jgi:hypothetical protein
MMTGACEPEDIIHRATRQAAMQFAAVRFGQLTSRLIWRLRRCPASGIFEGQFTCRTLWDEICVEVQEGPFDMPESFGLPDVSTAFEMTIDPYVRAAIDGLPKHEAVLLTLWAIDARDEEDQVEVAGAVSEDALIQTLTAMLRREAGSVDISRLTA